jgi:predicted MFS family arabinose efflux permease
MGAEPGVFYSGDRFTCRGGQPGRNFSGVGISDGQSARLLSIFGLTFALGAPLTQVLFGKLMRRTQVLAGMLVFGLGALIFAIAPDYRVLVVSRIVMGLGASLIGPVLVALGAELVAPQERGSAIATILLGVSMASMVGIPLATWVASVGGPRVLFALVALLSLLTAASVASGAECGQRR